jgi:hypothetical protein
MLLYKEKTPAVLNDLLLSFPYFQAHWKAIPSTYRLLNKILHWNEADKDTKGASEITWRTFYDIYGATYTQAIQATEIAGLILVTREYSEGHCYRYLLTPKAHAVLNDANKEYLHKLLCDPKEKRRNQVRVSKRGYNALRYGDTRDTQKNLIDTLSIEESELDKVCDQYPTAKAAHVRSLLISIVRKDYSELKHNAKDGRIWTPYAQLPAEVKAIIKVRGLSYQGTMDIRSCYPSCWGRYVESLSNERDSLISEREKWEELFLNRNKDPKTILACALGIARTDIKEVLIEYFNGRSFTKRKSDPYRKFDAYLQSEFPTLYALWKQTDTKQTGNNIGRMFETRLMLDGSIYDKAQELGIVVGYEYDGLSFYAENDSNINALCDYIEQRSLELLGFALVIVQKDNRELLEQLAARSQVETIFAEVQENDNRLATMRRCNHRRGTIKPDWSAYYLLRVENDRLLENLKEICWRTDVFAEE